MNIVKIMCRFVSCAEIQPYRAPRKVSCALLPPEFLLAQFVPDIEGTHESWNSETPVHDWVGVKCDEAGQVKAIQWESLYLKGTPRWSFLCHTIVDFSAPINELNGTLPFVEFPHGLVILILLRNKFFDTFHARDLPQSMEILNLGHNALYGPVEWDSLPKTLERLKLR